MEHVIAIGTVSRMARVKIPTIRYYESVGLLPAPARTDGNRRTYDMADVRRIRFIRHSRALGFSLDAIRQLLKLAGMPEQPCDGADAIAREHLEAIERKVVQLTALSGELKSMLERGAHGSIAECRVIEVLAGEDD
ncbi:MerR family transcriptional regulator [Roseomonas chloroacetimidivorans]|uniref:MerR family transcriptional regulator n=1 Tax=Roseomonas chloroacetimidivorans TaxID=1766656 RepID=UPI003C73FE7B